MNGIYNGVNTSDFPFKELKTSKLQDERAGHSVLLKFQGYITVAAERKNIINNNRKLLPKSRHETSNPYFILKKHFMTLNSTSISI